MPDPGILGPGPPDLGIRGWREGMLLRRAMGMASSRPGRGAAIPGILAKSWPRGCPVLAKVASGRPFWRDDDGHFGEALPLKEHRGHFDLGSAISAAIRHPVTP